MDSSGRGRAKSKALIVVAAAVIAAIGGAGYALGANSGSPGRVAIGTTSNTTERTTPVPRQTSSTTIPPPATIAPSSSIPLATTATTARTVPPVPSTQAPALPTTSMTAPAVTTTTSCINTRFVSQLSSDIGVMDGIYRTLYLRAYGSSAASAQLEGWNNSNWAIYRVQARNLATCQAASWVFNGACFNWDTQFCGNIRVGPR